MLPPLSTTPSPLPSLPGKHRVGGHVAKELDHFKAHL
jgi:hypothetical protein